MLRHAVFVFSDSGPNAFIAIPVNNFPVLPKGSPVSFSVGGVEVEYALIEEYQMSTKYGVEIHLNLKSKLGATRDHDVDKKFREVADVCKVEKGGTCEFVYPGSVDFKVKYPGKPTRNKARVDSD